MDSVENRANCLEDLLEVDRYDWDTFHEDFVCILVKYRYRKYLTVGEKDWYKNEVVNSTNCISIVDYTLPE
jgi:hypothetical protein